VYVGTSADTPEFVVTAIAQWWAQIRRVAYPQATQLLILGDAGGRYGSRPRRWQARLQRQLRDGRRLRVTVGHDPTGGSPWNPMAHGVFSPISLTGAGQPLRTWETMLGSLRDTTTTTDLQVTATLLVGGYQPGKKVTDAVMKTLEVAPHAIYPQ
jgi:hypothetical protein